MPVLTTLNDSQKVQDVLNDGDDVFFELVSADMWVKVIFQIKELNEIMTCGIVEFKMENTDTLEFLKKKIQKYVFKVQWESNKDTNVLYIVNQFDLMTIVEYINSDF